MRFDLFETFNALCSSLNVLLIIRLGFEQHIFRLQQITGVSKQSENSLGKE